MGAWVMLAAMPDDLLPWIFGVIAIALVVIGGVWAQKAYDARRVRERERAMQKGHEEQQAIQREREARAYEQHVRLNELAARKIEAEIRMLEAQLEVAEREKALRAQNEQFQRLAIQ